MPYPVPSHETRTEAQLREQFEVERELAERLRGASDTRGLYSEVYAEFLRRVPHHPAVTERDDPGAHAGQVALQLRLLEPFLRPDSRVLEVGGGNGALTTELSRRVRGVIAIEAAEAVSGRPGREGNREVLVSDAPPYPLPDGSVDLAFSCHFIEHLRPDDARVHLREMHRLLAPGGHYLCVTPHRLWGPHDISRYFADVPLGLHLREYSHRDLLGLLGQAGFRRRRVISRLGGSGAWLPHLATRCLEALLALPPVGLRRRALQALARGTPPPLRPLEQVIVIGSR